MSWYVINAEYDVQNILPYSRAITSSLSLSLDYSRMVTNTLSVFLDYSRQIGGYISVSLDYSRHIQNYLSVLLDYSRQIFDTLSGKAFYTFTKPKQIIHFFSQNINIFKSKSKKVKY